VLPVNSRSDPGSGSGRSLLLLVCVACTFVMLHTPCMYGSQCVPQQPNASSMPLPRSAKLAHDLPGHARLCKSGRVGNRR
jgi:hypothetical protein